MSCNNCNCNRIISATAYTVSSIFYISTNFSIRDLDNGERFILTLPVDLPAMTTVVPVQIIITVDGVSTALPIQDILGNTLMSDQLRFFPRAGTCACNSRGVIRMVYGANPAHFKVLQYLPESAALEYEEAEGTIVDDNSISSSTSGASSKTVAKTTTVSGGKSASGAVSK